MSSAGFVLAMNLCVAGLLAGAFAAIAAYDARVVAARWFAGAYAIGMSYYVMLALMPLIGGTRPAVVVEFAIFLAALAAFNVGIARKYEVASPWRLMAVISGYSAAAVRITQDLPRQSFTRLMAYQAPYFVMQAIGFGLVLSGRGRRRSDTALAAILAASALYFLSKPFMAQALGGWGSSPRTYLDSAYAIVSQTTGTVIALIPLSLFTIGWVISLKGAGYAEVRASLSQPLVTLIVALFLVVSLDHMRLGMKEIIEDYIHGEGGKLTLFALNTFFAIAVGVVSLFALAKLAFGG